MRVGTCFVDMPSSFGEKQVCGLRHFCFLHFAWDGVRESVWWLP